jgi:hypothetical protein
MTPMVFQWTGKAMEPIRRFQKAANAEFVVGQTYTLEEIQARSSASHAHYFATLHEGWMSLPESEGDRFPTEEHLRKYLLMKAGYRDERTIVCSSKAEAQRLSAFIKPMDDYAIVTAREGVVTVYTAKSQSMKAMGKEEFQASKQAVLDALEEMLGVAFKDRRM